MEEKHKIFLFGLDNAGKTTLLRYMKEKDIITDGGPTREFNIISMVIENIDVIIWDAPGQVKYRDTWDKGIIKSDVLLFLVDLEDPNRFQEAKTQLNKILDNEVVKNAALIVCFHKFDLESAQENLSEANEVLKLDLIRDRDVFWLKTSVYQEDSIEDLKFVIYNLLIIVEAKMNLSTIQKKL